MADRDEGKPREKRQLEYCAQHCPNFRRGFYKHGDMSIPSNFGCVNSQDLTVLPAKARDKYELGDKVEVVCLSETSLKACEIFRDIKKLDRM
jgi:hypothetical protein